MKQYLIPPSPPPPAVREYTGMQPQKSLNQTILEAESKSINEELQRKPSLRKKGRNWKQYQ